MSNVLVLLTPQSFSNMIHGVNENAKKAEMNKDALAIAKKKIAQKMQQQR